jgi:hypothetical protein
VLLLYFSTFGRVSQRGGGAVKPYIAVLIVVAIIGALLAVVLIWGK